MSREDRTVYQVLREYVVDTGLAEPKYIKGRILEDIYSRDEHPFRIQVSHYCSAYCCEDRTFGRRGDAELALEDYWQCFVAEGLRINEAY